MDSHNPLRPLVLLVATIAILLLVAFGPGGPPNQCLERSAATTSVDGWVASLSHSGLPGALTVCVAEWLVSGWGIIAALVLSLFLIFLLLSGTWIDNLMVPLYLYWGWLFFSWLLGWDSPEATAHWGLIRFLGALGFLAVTFLCFGFTYGTNTSPAQVALARGWERILWVFVVLLSTSVAQSTFTPAGHPTLSPAVATQSVIAPAIPNPTPVPASAPAPAPGSVSPLTPAAHPAPASTTSTGASSGKSVVTGPKTNPPPAPTGAQPVVVPAPAPGTRASPNPDALVSPASTAAPGSGSGHGLVADPKSSAAPALAVTPPLQPPVLLKLVRPRLPDGARKTGLSGEVSLVADIGADGAVAAVQVLTGLSGDVDPAVADTVQRWRFKPASQGGHTVGARARVTIEFRSGQSLGDLAVIDFEAAPAGSNNAGGPAK